MSLSFSGKPVFVKVPEDQTGLSGGVASFVCQAAGEPKPRITWMKKGKKVSSQRFEVRLQAVGAGRAQGWPPLPSGHKTLPMGLMKM
jgi:netrin-G3 ligand